jgi:hypothetical protein
MEAEAELTAIGSSTLARANGKPLSKKKRRKEGRTEERREGRKMTCNSSFKVFNGLFCVHMHMGTHIHVHTHKHTHACMKCISK